MDDVVGGVGVEGIEASWNEKFRFEVNVLSVRIVLIRRERHGRLGEDDRRNY